MKKKTYHITMGIIFAMMLISFVIISSADSLSKLIINERLARIENLIFVIFILGIVFRDEIMKFIDALGLIKVKIEVEQSLAVLEGDDVDFNKEDFLQWVEAVFVLFQSLWSNKEVERLRILEDSPLYLSHKTQIQGYIDDKQTDNIDIISVKYKDITRYARAGGFEFINVVIVADIVEYIEDESGEIIRGNQNEIFTMQYDITFKRKQGIHTKKIGNLQKVICPSCGAPIEISAAAKCNYCHTIVNTSKHSWVMSGYKWDIFNESF